MAKILPIKRESDTISPLDKLNWSDRNYSVLNNLICDYGIGGKYYDPQKPPYAVLDWDQTCAHFDVEEAVLHYQVFNFRFKLSKEQFRGILKDDINGVTQLSADYQNLPLSDINNDLINDYNFLYDNFLTGNGSMSFTEIQVTSEYRDFISKILFLYAGYCSTSGITDYYGYPWITYLLAGHTKSGIQIMANEAITAELGNVLKKETLYSPELFESKAGAITVSFNTGLRVLPEMQNLIQTFKRYGIEVFIVSASYKPVVEVIAGIGNYGYHVPSENVIGMELEADSDGKVLPEYKHGWVKTFREGKVEAINRVIKGELGKTWDPLFSAIDSDGDYEMATSFPGMKLTLIWNRVKGGDIGELSQYASDQMDNLNPGYILQGRNENTGLALPCSESILLGSTTLQLLKQHG